jgi:hypothetical protein
MRGSPTDSAGCSSATLLLNREHLALVGPTNILKLKLEQIWIFLSLTGTMSKVDMKFDMYETRKESELFCFPSISIVFGMSVIKFRAALKQASAEISITVSHSKVPLNVWSLTLPKTLIAECYLSRQQVQLEAENQTRD